MVRVVSTSPALTLYSFAQSTGRVNITPATDLIVVRTLGATNPDAAFANFDANTGTAVANNLGAAKAYVNSQLQAITGLSLTRDPLAGEFVVGDSDDQVLDTLADALSSAGKTISDLRVDAAANDAMTDTVPAYIVPPTFTSTGAFSSNQIALNWSLVNGATGYHVYRSTSPNVALIDANKITSTALTALSSNYTDAGVNANTSYYYKVQSLDSSRGASSTGSNEVFVTTPATVFGGGGGSTFTIEGTLGE